MATLQVVAAGKAADTTPQDGGYAALVPNTGGWRPVSIGAKTLFGTATVPGWVAAVGVNERHCAMRTSADGVHVIDLGSDLGTWVHGVACAPRPLLASAGTVVRLGRAPVIVVQERHEGAGRWLGIGRFGSWSPSVWPLLAELALVAQTPLPALILGESGTGKELAAGALHAASPRAAKPMISLNCAALHGDLLHAELFGAERGAYTGCVERRRGAFERADGGTLFLDEIGELSLPAQAALLRVLEVGEIQVLGGTTRPVDVRLVCATHRDLDAMVQQGTFRLDLWHRIAVAPLELPPLCQRAADIQPAARLFLQQFGVAGDLDDQAWAVLQHYDWPGNFRELRNVIARLCATSPSGTPTAADVRRLFGMDVVQPQRAERLLARQRSGDVQALVGGGVPSQQAWRQSGLPRATFYRYLKRVRRQAQV